MKEQALIEQVENYLLDSDTNFVKNSVRYVGVRENHVISNEKPKDYYFLNYDAVADENNQYSTQSYFVLIDKISKKISYILGPQSLEKIEDTE
ncbi:hypothetical protein [Chryseobacterium polytrichastri]|uniref:Immunity protein 35 n=1 Tax=Chryseobacterium polytrichastri TaxID=1302687 RepID=A0A1M7I0K9_9FLAO|nr:hypothetical protein [Chryseobacterium polytrichastri]SHM34331.1 hypothetical protein SAMN05444267_104329 [Chryseobacterium polytrichastri]